MKIEFQIILILLIHWFADFICQTRQMANNKSSSNYWLTVHVLTYVSIWLLIGLPFFKFTDVSLFIGITFIFHWLTDYITSRFTSWAWKDGNVYLFFAIVGFDQFLHYLQLIITYTILTK